MPNRNILLIEPGYKNKYPPLGLMKIAQYHGPYGKRDNVVFIKGEDKRALDQTWDRIYVTTLFTFEWKKIERSIDYALKVARGRPDKIFVGGIAASLMIDEFRKIKRWNGVRFIDGLLDQGPSISLQLDQVTEELYSEDTSGVPIEDCTPDYSILNQIDYAYPVHDAYFAYASRGCVRKCKFCGVPKLEGAQRDGRSITEVVQGIETLYGPKKDLMLMDNNIVASPTYRDIIAEIRDLGFERGATLRRGRVPVQRRVDFNQGVDARILSKDPMYLREMSTIALKPLRIAFDHSGLRKPYETSIRIAAEVGLHDLSNYMLYNFHDSPSDLYERMTLNIQLNEDLGIRIYSFPMRYQPVNMKDRSHIGEHWNKWYLRSIQIVLQATHGIASGAPQFFRRAFGANHEQFEDILIQPHHFTFNRTWYEEMEGQGELEEYQRKLAALSRSEREELLSILSSNDKGQFKKVEKSIKSSPLRSIFRHYVPLPFEEESKIWERQRLFNKEKKLLQAHSIPDDERVEDAGLEDDTEVAA